MDVQTEYYVRLLLLLVKGGMQICKAVAIRELAGTALDIVLKPLESVLKKKLLKSQYLLLFPKSGKPDIEDLDLSLLTVVLLDVLILSLNDVQCIQVIKQTRNKLAHNVTSSIDQADYNTTKTDLGDALNKLGKGLDIVLQKECSELIKRYTSEPLDEMTVIKYVKELRNDDELLQNVEEILENASADIKQEIKASESRMQESLSEIMDEIQKLQFGHSSGDVPLQVIDAIRECELCCYGSSVNTAMWYCEFCCQFMCTKCKQFHNSDKKHSYQRIIKGKPITFDMHGLDICDLHNKCFKYLCVDEDSLCCERCIEERHERCQNVKSIADLAEKSTSNPNLEIPRLQNEAKLLMEWTDSVSKDLANGMKMLPTHLEQQRSDLLDWFEKQKVAILNQFDREAQIVKDKANAIKHKSENDIAINRKQCDNVLEKTEIVKRSLKNIAKCGSNSQKVIAEFRLKEFQRTVKPLTGLNVVTFNVGPMQTPSLIMRESETLSVQVKSPATTPVKLFLVASLELKKQVDEIRPPFYSGLDFMPDGRLVAVDNYNMKCYLLNVKLEKVGSHRLAYYPQSVATVCEDQVAVTSGSVYKIDLLRVSTTNEITLIRRYEVKTEYISICMKDSENFVVGTINDTRPVRIVSLSGEEKDFNFDFPNKKYSLDSSASTHIINSDKVVLTERYENTINIYDVNAKNKVAVMNEEIVGPFGVAVGPFDCLFVCSSGNDSLVQLTQTGHILSSHKLDMNFPFTVCVSKDKRRLAVSSISTGKRFLQVFNIVF